MDFQILIAFHSSMQGITKVVTVRLSNPDPAEAKLMPVIKSCSCRFGSRYAGSNSLMPSPATIYSFEHQTNIHYHRRVRNVKIK